MPSDRDEAHAFFGFHSYADGTPRDAEPTMEAPEPPLVAGWAETPPWRQVPPPPEPVSWPRIAAVGGAAMGVLAAAAVGWNAMRGRPEPPAAAPATAPAAAPLEVVVADTPPPPLPRPAERLEVLPRPGAPVRTPLAEVVIPVTPPAAAPVVAQASPEPAPPVSATPSAELAAREASARAGPTTPRFNDCRDAPTRAYRMVCSDMRLAAADLRMKRAYATALAAGVPADDLRRDQADWLSVREDAARVSRRAVADIYRQRTRELYAMAADRRD